MKFNLTFVEFQVVKVRPNDKDAQLKYTECNKIVKKMAFERAIAVDDSKKSISDTINIDVIGEKHFRSKNCV